jgi:hypothetical protein
VVHAEEMQDAVEHEDADFGVGRVMVGAGLGAGALEGDGYVAEGRGERNRPSVRTAGFAGKRIRSLDRPPYIVG